MYCLPKGTEITKDIINDIIDYNEKCNNRYSKLERYYNGFQAILNRDKNYRLKNNKVVVNHAKNIVDTSIGYFLGQSVDYQVTDGFDIEKILKAYNKQNINKLDVEIATNVSIMGKQFEYVYSNENAEPKSCIVSNENTIMVYDDSVEHNELFAIMYRPIKVGTKLDHYEIIYIDDKEIRKYISNTNKLTSDGEVIPHTFGKVPVIEYVNNSRSQGDFECVIDVMDAYNLLMSDRINDKEQLVDAILCMYGVDFDKEDAKQLRESRMIANVPADARIEYITKTLNENEVDVLRRTLENDIYKISATPNMTDENFAQNSSGVAMKFKLLPFEQRIGIKERYFEEGLKKRFELYNNFLVSKSVMSEVPIEEVDAIFTRNLPNNDYETSQMINNLSDLVDKETLLSRLSFIKDASEIVEAKEKEDEETRKVLKQYDDEFSSYPDANNNITTKFINANGEDVTEEVNK